MSLEKQELLKSIETLPEEIVLQVLDYMEYLKFNYIINQTPEELIIKDKENLKKKLEEGLKDISEEVIIAYEPVWAIGTNETPSIEYIKNVVNYIKSLLNYDIIVLYGGSVDSAVIKELKEVNEVSGFLIGGNSTNISELNRIKEVVK